MKEAIELLLKHLYLQGGDGLGISDGRVYNACLNAIMEALTIPVVVDTFVCDNHKPMVTSDWRGLRCDDCGKFEKPKAN